MLRPKEVKKGFGFWTGWFVVLASMIGSGILMNSGPILKITGSYPALFLLWSLGGCLALCGALSMSELASGLPHVGGDYVFVREAFGRASGFVYGWSMVVIGFAAPTALIAFTTGAYLQPMVREVFPLWGESFPLWFASGLIVLFTIIHSLGHKNSSLAQGLTTSFFALLLLGFSASVIYQAPGSFSHLGEGHSLFQVGWGPLSSGLILVMYAYTGWNGSVYLAGEMREAEKKVPLTLCLGCISVAVIYLIVNFGYAYVFSLDQVKQLSDADLPRLAEVAYRTSFGVHAAHVFAILVSLGVIASISAYTLAGPRIVYAMAHDRLFPGWIGQLHPKTHVPVVATLFQSGCALLFLWTGTFEQILNFSGFGLAVVGLMAVAPIFVLRRKKSFRPKFRVPLYPFTPAFFLLVTGAMLIGGFLDNPRTSALSIATILLGFPLHWLLQRAGLLRRANPAK